jgi:hypothetical protein
MPTKRARLTITETPEVERRLDRAAARHPELAGRRRDLLLWLSEVGEQALEEREAAASAREEAKRRVLARTRSIGPEEADAMLAAREAEWEHELDR